MSSHSRWILQAKKQELETVSPNEIMNMTKDKRPQDWTLEERFNMVLSCNTLDDEALSEYCRARGIFPVMLRNGSWILSVSIQQRIGQFH